MTNGSPNLRRPFARPRHGRGFTFVEVMFAVMILAIGFIMIAAMLPMAIQQTQQTVDDTIGAAVGRSAVDHLARKYRPANTSAFGYPLTVVYPNTLDSKVDPTVIHSVDPRYAWAALYRKLPPEQNSAMDYRGQVIVFVVRNRNAEVFTPQDLERRGTNPTDIAVPANLEPRSLTGTFSGDKLNGYKLQVSGSNAKFLADGAHVVVNMPTKALTSPWVHTGSVFRLGRQVNAASWDVLAPDVLDNPDDPDKPLPSDDPNRLLGNEVTLFVMGRGYTEKSVTDLSVSGKVMDITVYSSFIR